MNDDERLQATRCTRCGLRVCAPAHDRPEDCIEALKAELARLRKEHNDEMREAQRAEAEDYL
jgi:hypothetical protein